MSDRAGSSSGRDGDRGTIADVPRPQRGTSRGSEDTISFRHGTERWFVHERSPRAHDAVQTPSLVFESEAGIRRVRNFPGSWRELSDGELYELSWGT